MLFVEDGRLQFVYNFFGELEQRRRARSPAARRPRAGVAYARTGTVEGSHTRWATSRCMWTVRRSPPSPVSSASAHVRTGGRGSGCRPQSRATGIRRLRGAVRIYRRRIAKAVVDVSGAPYIDLERQLAAAFAKTDSDRTAIGHTGAVIRLACAVLLIGLATVACSRTDEGTAVRAGDMPTPLSSKECDRDAPTSAATPTTDIPDSSQPGIVKRPSAPSPRIRSCAAPSSAQTAVATIVDPSAPTITVALPSGWTTQPGTGDVAARLVGPERNDR